MKKCLLCLAILSFILNFYLNEAMAQKLSIDTSVLNNWSSIGTDAIISDNGKYTCFTVNTGPKGKNQCFVRETTGVWERSFENIIAYFFVENGSKISFLNKSDSLFILDLNDKSIIVKPQVKKAQEINYNGRKLLTFTQSKGGTQNLVFLDLVSNKNLDTIDNVIDFFQIKNNNVLLLHKRINEKDILSWFNPFKKSEITLFSGEKVSNIIFDNDVSKIAFVAGDKIKSVFIGHVADSKALLLISESKDTSKIFSNNRLDAILKFSLKSDLLFFRTKELPKLKEKNTGAMVDIWNYQDAKLQSQQLLNKFPMVNLAVINLATNKIIPIESINDRARQGEQQGNFVFLTSRSGGDYTEEYWNKKARANNYVVDCRTGDRFIVPIQKFIGFSFDGNYLVGTDSTNKKLLCYNALTKSTYCITDRIPISLLKYSDVSFDNQIPFLQILGWQKRQNSMFINDGYDIWKIPLSTNDLPFCLTKLYGRKNNIRFNFTDKFVDNIIPDQKEIILSSFNLNNKRSGFYKLTIQKNESVLEQLSEDNYRFNYDYEYREFASIKAKNASTWVVRRENIQESPNFFRTSDFKSFYPISNVYPEKSYNWITSKLVTFEGNGGKEYSGILYLPENFDPNKKYPVIMNYYEKVTDFFNVYKRPDLPYDNINIPWVVSRGYIVFTPDIYYDQGKPGESAFKIVNLATDILCTYNWVDTTRIALQGHSFGGFETNYIVTHTNRFRAAVSACATANSISNYLGLFSGGASKQKYYEFEGQGRIGQNLWDAPDLYIANSPIFKVQNVNTPILLINNKNDLNVTFDQGVQFFTALRRLGKKSWLLQYDGEGHNIFSNSSRYDYMVRMDQFFDHYLKDMPAPKWMTKGVPAALKAIDSGFELDYKNITPGGGLTTKRQ